MSDLTNIIKKVLRENRGENYMFFSNLKQMRRQICNLGDGSRYG